VAVDFIRAQIWHCSEAHFWLRQNILIFAKEALTEDAAPFGRIPVGPLSIVHPELYLAKAEALSQYAPVLELLLSGKTVVAERSEDGSIMIKARDDG
jgi:hypothetical protein